MVWRRHRPVDVPLAISVAEEAMIIGEPPLTGKIAGLRDWLVVGPHLSERHLLETHLKVQLKKQLGVKLLRKRKRRKLQLSVIEKQGSL